MSRYIVFLRDEFDLNFTNCIRRYIFSRYLKRTYVYDDDWRTTFPKQFAQNTHHVAQY